MLSKKVKLNLSCNQKLILETLSNEHRLLYNFLLEKVKDNLDFKQINSNYKLFRKTNNLTINSKSAQNTSIGLINNIKSYLTLKKKDKSARFPNKFKSHKFFTSFLTASFILSSRINFLLFIFKFHYFMLIKSFSRLIRCYLKSLTLFCNVFRMC